MSEGKHKILLVAGLVLLIGGGGCASVPYDDYVYFEEVVILVPVPSPPRCPLPGPDYPPPAPTPRPRRVPIDRHQGEAAPVTKSHEVRTERTPTDAPIIRAPRSPRPVAPAPAPTAEVGRDSPREPVARQPGRTRRR